MLAEPPAPTQAPAVYVIIPAYGRPALAGALALSTGGLLLVACLVAGPIPTRLGDYPREAAPVVLSR